MKKSIIASLLLVAGFATSACAAEEFSLKGNVQFQAEKSVNNDTTVFNKTWVRANIGGQYKSDNIDGLVMLRIFAPEFGNKLSDGTKTANYDRILADLYWVNYKLALGNDMLNIKLGHWKTDWSQSTNFGTYIDKDLTKRGLWMRDYSHNALEVGWKHGLSQLNAMAAITNGTANQGYVRVEEAMKFTFPLDVKVAYRSNLIDGALNSAYLTHRVAAYASYKIEPAFLRLYGEYACLYTQEEATKTHHKAVAAESKYFTPGEMQNPFYLGMEFAPKSGILSTLMTSLFVEWECIFDRADLYKNGKDYDDWAWVAAYVKTIGKTKLQFSVYSENEMSDVGMAFRLTSTFK